MAAECKGVFLSCRPAKKAGGQEAESTCHTRTRKQGPVCTVLLLARVCVDNTHTPASLTRNTLASPSAAQHTLHTSTRTHIVFAIHIRARGHHQLERLAVPALRRQVRRRRAALPIDNIHIRCCVTMRVYTCTLWVDFG